MRVGCWPACSTGCSCKTSCCTPTKFYMPAERKCPMHGVLCVAQRSDARRVGLRLVPTAHYGKRVIPRSCTSRSSNQSVFYVCQQGRRGAVRQSLVQPIGQNASIYSPRVRHAPRGRFSDAPGLKSKRGARMSLPEATIPYRDYANLPHTLSQRIRLQCAQPAHSVPKSVLASIANWTASVPQPPASSFRALPLRPVH